MCSFGVLLFFLKENKNDTSRGRTLIFPQNGDLLSKIMKCKRKNALIFPYHRLCCSKPTLHLIDKTGTTEDCLKRPFIRFHSHLSVTQSNFHILV